jgi:hypothetical protein
MLALRVVAVAFKCRVLRSNVLWIVVASLVLLTVVAVWVMVEVVMVVVVVVVTRQMLWAAVAVVEKQVVAVVVEAVEVEVEVEVETAVAVVVRAEATVQMAAMVVSLMVWNCCIGTQPLTTRTCPSQSAWSGFAFQVRFLVVSCDVVVYPRVALSRDR